MERVINAHTPEYLQGFSIGISPRGLVADRLAPVVRVDNQSDKYRKWTAESFIAHDTLWAPGTVPKEIRSSYSNDQFFSKLHKLRHPLLDQEKKNADADLKLEMRYTKVTTTAVAIAREVRVAALAQNQANYLGGLVVTKAGGAEWDSVPANVIEDLKKMLSDVADSIKAPISELSVVIPEYVFRKTIQHNANVLDRIRYSQLGVVTADLLVAILGCREVILPAVQTATLPNATADLTTLTTANLWADNVIVAKLGAEGGTDDEPAWMYSFNWEAGTGGQRRRVRIYRAADEGVEADYVEVSEAMDEKQTMNQAAGIIRNVLA